jgi:hypothetical protein
MLVLQYLKEMVPCIKTQAGKSRSLESNREQIGLLTESGCQQFAYRKAAEVLGRVYG